MFYIPTPETRKPLSAQSKPLGDVSLQPLPLNCGKGILLSKAIS